MRGSGLLGKLQRIIYSALAVVILLIVAVAMIPKAPETPEQIAAREAADAECRKSLNCWGTKNKVSASIYCLSAIDRRAGEIKWTDGADLKLRYQRWLNRDEGSLTFYGRALQVRNAFGAWVNYAFECDYDPKTDTLLALRLKPNQ